MSAPYSNSEKNTSPHAETLSLRGLRSRVLRADLCAVSLHPLRLEPGRWAQTLAEVPSARPILRGVPAQACAHACKQRGDCFRVGRFIRAVVPSFSLRTQKFNGLADESVPRTAGNAGVRPAASRVADSSASTLAAAPQPLGGKRAFLRCEGAM